MKGIRKIVKSSWFQYSSILLLLFILFVVYAHYRINSYSKKFVFDLMEDVPFHKVTMVLGTGKYLKNGTPNLFFENRIRAAVELFEHGKTDYLVVSGDNSSHYYNEPEMMKEELVKRGVPACRITCDYAGLRTFDSVIRMKRIFGVSSFIVVSQKFHNQRAVYIGHNHGISVIGYNAKDVIGLSGWKTHFREYFARAMAIIDVHIWPASPKYLGERVPLINCP